MYEVIIGLYLFFGLAFAVLWSDHKGIDFPVAYSWWAAIAFIIDLLHRLITKNHAAPASIVLAISSTGLACYLTGRYKR